MLWHWLGTLFIRWQWRKFTKWDKRNAPGYFRYGPTSTLKLKPTGWQYRLHMWLLGRYQASLPTPLFVEEHEALLDRVEKK